MSSTRSHRSHYHRSRRAALCLALILLFGMFGSLRAQDTPPTEMPTETSAPTVEPTTEIPTEAPTQEPTTEVPTEAPTVAPTDVPTEDVTPETTEAPTVEVTPSPTVVAEPPVFQFANGTTFEGTAGTPLVVEASVSDSLGLVRIIAEGSTGTVSLTTVDPVETSAPYNTLFTLNYTAPGDFTGPDMVTLTAINPAGTQSSIALTVNVLPPAPTPTPTLTPTPLPEPVKELLIQYNPAASEETIQAMLASLGAIETGRLPQIGVIRALVPESLSQPATAMATLQSTRTATLAGVTNIEENIAYHLMYTPTDPLFAQQVNLQNSTQGIYAPLAWDASTTRGLGITVAVIDSGVDLQHTEMLYQTVPGWDFVNDDSNPDDDSGHGTHVAGIIAAKALNLKGTVGIAYNAKILPLKACDATDACPLYYVAGSIIHAVDKGARIINLSLGSYLDASTLRGAINYALSQNVVVVAAVGNCGDAGSLCLDENSDPLPPNVLMYPANYPGVIGVGAHDSFGVTSSFSSENTSVDLSAPGENILSTVPVELDTDAGTPAGYDGTFDGTSMAAAHVSGSAALLLSAKVATTPATVLDALVCGAEDVAPAGYDVSYGNGRLKADLAMNWRNNSASCKVTEPNDNFQFAKVITIAPFSISQPISDRSVTEQITDPAEICTIPREQTLWYSYRPAVAGYYQFTTLGSSYNNVIGVFRGSEGALTSVGCTPNSQVAVALDAAQTYYIAVSTNGAAVNDQVLQLRVNPTILTNNLDYQENSTSIAYVGMWTRTYLVGTSGAYTQQTSDPNAMAVFSFRGTRFDYVRTVGPDRGAVQVYINGVLASADANGDLIPETTISNRAAITKGNQLVNFNVPGAIAGQWNTVYIRPADSAAPGWVPGVVDVDRIRTYDFDNSTLAAAITTKANDNDARLRYSDGHWTTIPSGTAYLGNLKETNVQDATVKFRFSGNALTIFRMTGPSGWADMQVTIDNSLTQTVSNTVAGSNVIRPYTIDGLTTMTHVVEIRKLGATGPGSNIQLDAVQPLTAVNLAAPATYDERSPYIAYRGSWTDNANPPVTGAYLSTTRSLNAGSEASFKFLSNDLCIGYRRPNSALQIKIDGALLTTILEDNISSGFTVWCIDATYHRLLADTVHYAELVAVAGAVPTFSLDYVRPQRYATLTPALKLVQETHLSFRYSTPANWATLTTTASSPGGYKPQGGALKATFADNTTITFYINGTGFILYTVVGMGRGCWEMSVDDVPTDPIDLLDENDLLRIRPLGYGISSLPAGIHRVELKADTDCTSAGLPEDLSTYEVDFDAVRVFP